MGASLTMSRQSLFLPTPSVRRATPGFCRLKSSEYPFLPTPSVRRATGRSHPSALQLNYFYPRPP